MIKAVLADLLAGRHLSEQGARELMAAIMDDDLTAAQFGAAVTALRLKGESVDEIVGFASEMRDRSLAVRADGVGMVIDTCGTGGDGLSTFNVSTASALVVASLGLVVAKHGNRAASSLCGSADVLEALGIAIDLPPDAITACLERIGIGFMYAPRYHPAMRSAAGPRRELGFRTVFNTLGPLTNPARVKTQVVGVSDPTLTRIIAEVLQRLGARHAFVVCGDDGTDEFTLTTFTHVAELHDGMIREYQVAPEDVGLARATRDDVRGGDAQTNADILEAVLRGGGSQAHRDMIALNAAAALVAGELVVSLADGVTKAHEALRTGAGWRKVEQWRAISTRLHTASMEGTS